MYKRISLIILFVAIAACGPSSKTSHPVLDADAVAQAVAEGIEVKFYGESCDVAAPEVLPIGEYVFVFNDLEGKQSADLYIGRLTDGHTFQDLLDPQGDEPGKYYHKPEWLIYAEKTDSEWDLSTGVKSVTYFLEEGEHAIYVSNVLPTNEWGLWFCMPVMVVETSSG
jgi:hypothetical protein